MCGTGGAALRCTSSSVGERLHSLWREVVVARLRWMLALRTVRQSSTQYASSKPRREQRAIRRSPSQYRMHSVAACDDGQRHGSGSGPFGEGRVTQHQRPGVDSVPGGSRPRLGRTGGHASGVCFSTAPDGNAQVTGTKTYSKRIARAPSANEVCRPCISRLRRAEPMLCAICSTKGRMPGSSTITATSRSIWLASALLRAEAAPRPMELLQLRRGLLPPEREVAVCRQEETPQPGRQTWPRSANLFGTQLPANSLYRLARPRRFRVARTIPPGQPPLGSAGRDSESVLRAHSHLHSRDQGKRNSYASSPVSRGGRLTDLRVSGSRGSSEQL